MAKARRQRVGGHHASDASGDAPRTDGDALALSWPLVAQPRVRVAGRFVHEATGQPRHYCGSTHALHVYEYPCTITIGRRAFAVVPGDVSLSPANVATVYDLPATGHHFCVHFHPAELPGRGVATARLPLHCSLGEQSGALGQKVMAIARLKAAGVDDPVAEAAAASAMQSLLLWLVMASRGMQVQVAQLESDRAADMVASSIERQLDQPLRVPDIARDAGLSQNYLARRFRERFGMTIPRYILTRRIEHARQLLTITDQPVQTIAAQVGMPDAQHFNKQFRKLTGTSPTAWRQSQRGDGVW